MSITKFCYAFIFIVTICTMTISGCRSYEVNSADNNYKIFTQKEGIGQFSFEYSTKYKVLKVETASTYTDITLNNPEANEDWDISYISVFCSVLEEGESGYQNAIEEFIKLCSIFRDFNILERFPIMMAGEPGEEVVLSYLWESPDSPEGLSKVNSEPTVHRIIMFTHKNNLWWLQIDSPESYADSAKADFEHIKQTFKILN